MKKIRVTKPLELCEKPGGVKGMKCSKGKRAFGVQEKTKSHLGIPLKTGGSALILLHKKQGPEGRDGGGEAALGGWKQPSKKGTRAQEQQLGPLESNRAK